jgi:hypothetical protein
VVGRNVTKVFGIVVFAAFPALFTAAALFR